MIFDDKSLRDIREDDIRALVNAGMAEYSRLEFKSDLYDNGDRGRREFLLDICMFANSGGGTLLVGIPELRGLDGQPSGIPDPAAELGIASANPEADLQGYDARIVAGIEDRLPVESHPIALQNGRFILAFRVPNSLRTPHCVRYQGHIYFPSRRERHRYDMDLREIKEQTMRTASQLQRAEELLGNELARLPHTPDSAILFVAILPIFYDDFLVDITRDDIVRLVANFDVTDPNRAQYRNPEYTFHGLGRSDLGTNVLLHRTGMLSLTAKIPGRVNAGELRFYLAALDIFIHDFSVKAQGLYQAAGISGPILLKAQISTGELNLRGVWNYDAGEAVIPARRQAFVFPAMQIVSFSGPVEAFIRPTCNHVHQMFGRVRSQWFDDAGNWRDPRN